MLSQCLVSHITKKVNSYFIGFGTTATLLRLEPFKYKVFIKVFQCILKSIKLFFIKNYLYSNAKKYKLDKKLTNFDLTADSKI